MTEQTALDVLWGCWENDHCPALLSYLKGYQDSESLSYEDVFYPLRHHHDEGLALSVTDGHGTEEYVWGSGDFIFLAEEERQVMAHAIDPVRLWSSLQMDGVSFDVVRLDDTPFAEGQQDG